MIGWVTASGFAFSFRLDKFFHKNLLSYSESLYGDSVNDYHDNIDEYHDNIDDYHDKVMMMFTIVIIMI